MCIVLSSKSKKFVSRGSPVQQLFDERTIIERREIEISNEFKRSITVREQKSARVRSVFNSEHIEEVDEIFNYYL